MGQLPTLTFKWHQQLASAIIVCAFLFMYMEWQLCQSVCVLRLILKVRWNYIHTPTHTVSNFLEFWLGNEYGGVRAEGSVTLGQGDTSGQVCVCERTLVCQRFVPGQQVASQRTSVTFYLFLPLPFSLCPSPPSVLKSQIFSPTQECSVSAQQVWVILDWSACIDTGVGGLFMNLCEMLFWQSIAE